MSREPCVYAWQESPDDFKEVVVLFKIKNGLITQICKTMIPLPSTVFRTGEIPQ